MFLDYVATRELVGSGNEEIETSASMIDRIPIVDQSTSVSMSKVGRESQFNSLEHKWSITTIPFLVENGGVADLARWREFQGSSANDEPFTFDAFGTKASPDNAISAVLVKSTYRENRTSNLYMTISFEVLEI
jgi:hypothetical protein